MVILRQEILEVNERIKSYPYWISRNFDVASRKPVQWLLKRAIDIGGSLFGLIMLSPILLLVSLLINLDAKGGTFYKQERVGLYGKKFFMYKFRTMKANADKDFESLKKQNETSDNMFKLKDDPRITKIGKFLRKYSIDEIPQFINILKGEMSLVGPRPPLEREVALYENWHYLRFSTLPGITGLWQVSGRSDITDFKEVVLFDYLYTAKWTLLQDIKIILKTIPVVISAKGAS